MNNKLRYPNSPLKFETALFLSPNQAEALNHFNFIVTGFYGAGKTTALECAIDKIIEKPAEFPNPDCERASTTWLWRSSGMGPASSGVLCPLR